MLRLSQTGSWSSQPAACGEWTTPRPSTVALPSQKVRPAMKQIFATSMASRP